MGARRGKFMAMRNWGALLLVSSAIAWGQGADVGLVNLVSGNVSYTPLLGAPGRVQSYMKVRAGDRITVAAGARVRLVYFDGARQELWDGPAQFRAGRGASEPVSGNHTEVTALPAGAPQRLARVPELMQFAKLGGIQVRGGAAPAREAGGERQADTGEARSAYEKMRREMPADDITPELFLYAALHEHHLYKEMKAVTDEMLRRQPQNEDAKALASWAQSQSGR